MTRFLVLFVVRQGECMNCYGFFNQKNHSAEKHFISFLKCDEAVAAMGFHIIGANKAGGFTWHVSWREGLSEVTTEKTFLKM